MRSKLVVALSLLGCIFTPMASRACAVPVFRYALERWEPGIYDVYVFFDSPLTAEQLRAVELLHEAKKQAPVNMRYHLVDVNRVGANADALAVFQSLPARQRTALPRIAVAYPKGSANPGVFFTAPVDRTNIQLILHSPARARIVEDIVKGHTAVWLVVESGGQGSAKAVSDLISRELARFARKKNLPEDLPLIFASLVARDGQLAGLPSLAAILHPEAASHVTQLIDKLNGPVLPIRLKFSVVRIRRDDPRERFFIASLLHSEPKIGNEPALWETNEPIAFPVFGRGRARFALVGKGINADNIANDAAFLTGPCTCTIKNENPGFDLLLQADWGRAIGDSLIPDQDVPPLIGIGGFGLPAPAPKSPEKKPAKQSSLRRPSQFDGIQLAMLTRHGPRHFQGRQWVDALREVAMAARQSPKREESTAGSEDRERAKTTLRPRVDASPKIDDLPKSPSIQAAPEGIEVEELRGSLKPSTLLGEIFERHSLFVVVGAVAVIGLLYLIVRLSAAKS